MNDVTERAWLDDADSGGFQAGRAGDCTSVINQELPSQTSQSRHNGPMVAPRAACRQPYPDFDRTDKADSAGIRLSDYRHATARIRRTR